VYNTLSAARGTIKSKLAGKDEKTDVKTMVLLPLGALFFMEEEAFAASYIHTAAPSIAGANIVGEAAATTVISTKGYVVAVCVAAVCMASVVTYIALQPSVEEPYESVYETYISAAEEVADYGLEYIMEEVQLIEPIEEPISSVIREPEVIEEPELIPEWIEEVEVIEEVELVTVEEPDPEPIHVDRTAEILAALAAAGTVEDVTTIINRYSFKFVTSMRDATDMLFKFYVLDEGSGDILIGITVHEDGSRWRMRFAHFAGGQMPVDTFDLLHFMAQ
jgi:hypothetical protein